jgi:2-phosphosulfolactate phosphatase
MEVDVRSATDAAATIGEDDCAVVIDALRASATAISLLETGAKSVVPVSGNGADRFGDDVVKVGEHHGERIEGFDLGNSPLRVRERADLIEGEDVVLRTTNGTRCVERVEDAGVVMMGSLLNAEALIETCRDRLPDDARVVFVPAGRRGDPAPEDTYTAIALGRRLQAALGDPVTLSAPENLVASSSTGANATTTATAAPTATAGGSGSSAEHGRKGGESEGSVGSEGLRPAEDVFVESDTGRFLASKNWSEDVRFCARADVFEAVPMLEDGRFVDGRPSSRSVTASAGHAESTEATDDAERRADTSHLDDIDDGCGCAEIWDHLSQQRE